MDKNQKIITYVSAVIVLVITIFTIINNNSSKDNNVITGKELEAIILSINDNNLTITDSNNIIYTFNIKDIIANIGDKILIKYTGLLDKNKELQNVNIINYTTSYEKEENIPNNWQDNGIFSSYYTLAYNKLKTLSLEEKIGQLILARYPDSNAEEDLRKYNLSGYVFFEKDFKDKTEKEVKDTISKLQKEAKIPILTAVDEEGGTVVRVSSNPNLVSSKFHSPRELYISDGFNKIKEDTINKSKILSNLGLNLNLAPVVDISINPNDYMYKRTIGENTQITKEYAQIVIETSKNTNVSYTLKHFPGYGNNNDTHNSSVTDTRTYDDILNNDLPPFTSGIKAGAEAVLVSHNIVDSIDSNNPASLSASVHNLLRNKLNFTGIIITDDLTMGAVSQISNNATKAILSGNDLIITTNYIESINSIKSAVNNGTINKNLIDKLAFRVISWKYYKKLIFEEK